MHTKAVIRFIVILISLVIPNMLLACEISCIADDEAVTDPMFGLEYNIRSGGPDRPVMALANSVLSDPEKIWIFAEYNTTDNLNYSYFIVSGFFPVYSDSVLPKIIGCEFSSGFVMRRHNEKYELLGTYGSLIYDSNHLGLNEQELGGLLHNGIERLVGRLGSVDAVSEAITKKKIQIPFLLWQELNRSGVTLSRELIEDVGASSKP